MKKLVLLLLILFCFKYAHSATIYINVHNVNGNLVSNAYIRLYDSNWNQITTGYTNASGMATFALLDYGTYNYEVYYTGESQEFWGSDESFNLGSPTITRNFTRYWPYKYSEVLPSSSYIVGQQVTFNFTVRNNVSLARNVKVELFVDRSRSSSWDFNQESSVQSIPSNNTRTFTFNFTPSSSGTYYWKMRIWSYSDGSSSYIVTDSYNWQTAFTANFGSLDVYVRNVNGSYIQNAFVDLYNDSKTDYTDATGKLSLVD